MEIEKQEPSNSSVDTPNISAGSFGNRLKQERINKNLSIADVSSELYILPRHIEAIESEDFKALPQLAFARGFVVKYAKFLGVDAEQIAASFNNAYPNELRVTSIEEVESPLKPMGTLQREEGKRSIRINPLLVLGAIALIVLAIFLYNKVSAARDDAQNEDSQSTLVDDISDNEQSVGAAVDTVGATSTPSNSTETAVNDSEPALAQDSAIDTATAASTEDATLDFWVTSDTPISVVDATGQTLLNGVQSRGAYKLTGKPPFKIQVDNVSRVSLNLDGQPIKLRDFAQDNKANFSLAP